MNSDDWLVDVFDFAEIVVGTKPGTLGKFGIQFRDELEFAHGFRWKYRKIFTPFREIKRSGFTRCSITSKHVQSFGFRLLRHSINVLLFLRFHSYLVDVQVL